MATSPAYSLRVVLAKPPQGDGDISAVLDRLMVPNETMRQAISGGLLQLAFTIQKERFTGKGPFPVAEKRLGVVTGRLRRDLHAEPATLTDGGYSGRIGSAVEYFGAHEVGFKGEVSVRAHVRAAHTLKERPISSKAGKVRIRPAHSRLEQSVRAHKRKVTIPARMPLRTGIEQHSMRILGAAISKAVKILTSTPSA